MSAMHHEGDHSGEVLEADGSETGSDPGDERGSGDETLLAGTPVVVRRNAGLAALIGAAASGMAIAYLWRAVDSGAALDWALCLVLALIGGFYLSGLLDAKTPLLVADDLGVRIRLGNQWRGLPWDAVAAVEVQPRRSLVQDGRLVFRPHSLARALDGLESRGRRSALLNQKMYGAALAVPMGLTTRTSERADAVADAIAALSRGRADVLLLQPEPEPEQPEGVAPDEAVPPAASRVEQHDPDTATIPDDATTERAPARLLGALRLRRPVSAPAESVASTPAADPGTEPTEAVLATADVAEERAARRSLLGGIGTIVSRVAKGRSHDIDANAVVAEAEAERDLAEETPVEEGPAESGGHDAPAASVAPLREARPALRAEVTRDAPATTLGAAAAQRAAVAGREPLPEGRDLHRPGSVDLVFEPPVSSTVRPISRLGDPVEPLVIDDFQTEPAYDPVIGPELAAARTRVGLTVDELADRTRIRPHVIESIEVDDFAPCGGDFYARGHLRTLARVLGKDPAPLLEQFDNRYATAPINARRVFEAELATGMTGSMRSTVGGPNWGLMIGVVLTLVLVWGLVRLFATEPEMVQSPAPVLNGSAGVDRDFPGVAKPGPAAKPLPVTLVATQDGSRVVVRNGEGRVVFAGRLVIGEKKSLKVTPPVRVRALNAGAVEVQVRGRDRGPVGELGEPGRRTFTRPASR